MKVVTILVTGILFLQMQEVSGRCEDVSRHCDNVSGQCDIKDLGYAINSFAIDLLKELCLKSVDGNIFFSPFSISTALAMTQIGTAGETLRQMETTLRFDKNKCQNYYELFGLLLSDINAGSTEYTLKSANNAFPSTRFNMDSMYLFKVIMYFKAQIKEFDYATEARLAVKEINEWISNNTEGKLKDVLSPADVNALTKLILVNAIYFKGDWKYTFDTKNTKPAPFYSPGKKIIVDMMMQTLNESQKHVYIKDEDLDAHILELPYKGEEVSMVIMLPASKSGDRLKALKDLEEKLTATKLTSILEEIDCHNFTEENRKVNLRFPKLLIEWRSELKKHLKNLGMMDVFGSEPSLANFCRMCHGTCDICLSEVIHQTFVEVNEKGTEAAAVTITSIPIIIGGGPVDFRVDQPFLFLIRHKKSNAILFMGHITEATIAKETCMTDEPCMKKFDGSLAEHCCGCRFQFKDPTKKKGKPEEPQTVLRNLKKKCIGDECREACLTEACMKKYRVKDNCRVKTKKSKPKE